MGLESFLSEAFPVYKNTYNRVISSWGMHDVQNLVVLCNSCHTKLHNNGNGPLRKKYRHSFTCPKTGYNVPFKKIKKLY